MIQALSGKKTEFTAKDMMILNDGRLGEIIKKYQAIDAQYPNTKVRLMPQVALSYRSRNSNNVK